jgi:hypothetical protein
VNIIETAALGKNYGRTWALRDCTFAMPEGHRSRSGSPGPAHHSHSGAGTFRPFGSRVTATRIRRHLMTGGFAKPPNRPRQNSFGCSPDQDFTLTCPYLSSSSSSSWPGAPQVAGSLHSNRSVPDPCKTSEDAAAVPVLSRRHAVTAANHPLHPHKSETPAIRPHGRLGLKRKHKGLLQKS